MMIRRLTGHRRAYPHLLPSAVAAISTILGGGPRVLEFGAGLSTVWFAQHVAFVHAIEDDEDWYRQVRTELDKRGLTNTRLDYFSPDSPAVVDAADGTFDFTLVDSSRHRDVYVETAAAKTRPGGYVCLDDTDDGTRLDVLRTAERRLLEAATRETAKYVTGFANNVVIAHQTPLVRTRLVGSS